MSIHTVARLGRANTNTEPLCPRVIRRVSSMYIVRNHPVGPMSPKGKVYSKLLFRVGGCRDDDTSDGIDIRHSVNLTLTRRASDCTGVNFTVTVNDTRRGGDADADEDDARKNRG